jgi:hypothetical protein
MSDDPFDDARSAFVKMDDLEGRLLLITATDHGTRASTLPGQVGKEYVWVETTTVVLDGEITELIDEVPTVLDGFQFSGSTVTGMLKPKIRTGRPTLGRLVKQKARQKGFSDAWALAKVEDEKDRELARTWVKNHSVVERNPFDE